MIKNFINYLNTEVISNSLKNEFETALKIDNTTLNHLEFEFFLELESVIEYKSIVIFSFMVFLFFIYLLFVLDGANKQKLRLENVNKTKNDPEKEKERFEKQWWLQELLLGTIPLRTTLTDFSTKIVPIRNKVTEESLAKKKHHIDLPRLKSPEPKVLGWYEWYDYLIVVIKNYIKKLNKRINNTNQNSIKKK